MITMPETLPVNFKVMKALLFLFLLLPFTASAQKLGQHQLYQEKADSIMKFFLGKEIFKRYLTQNARKTDDDHVAPNEHFFSYNFRHPKFEGETFVITLSLDSAGKLIPTKVDGLIQIGGENDSAWTAKSQALQLLHDNHFAIKKKSIRLEWDRTNVSYDAYNDTHDLRDIIPGDLVWVINGKEKFRGHTYQGAFQVDVLTGKIIKRFAIPWD